MIYLLVLLPVVMICSATMIVASSKKATLRKTLLAMFIAAILSGGVSAGVLRYVVIINPTVKTDISFGGGGGGKTNTPSQAETNRKIKNNEKWSGDFWESIVNH